MVRLSANHGVRATALAMMAKRVNSLIVIIKRTAHAKTSSALTGDTGRHCWMAQDARSSSAERTDRTLGVTQIRPAASRALSQACFPHRERKLCCEGSCRSFSLRAEQIMKTENSAPSEPDQIASRSSQFRPPDSWTVGHDPAANRPASGLGRAGHLVYREKKRHRWVEFCVERLEDRRRPGLELNVHSKCYPRFTHTYAAADRHHPSPSIAGANGVCGCSRALRGWYMYMQCPPWVAPCW